MKYFLLIVVLCTVGYVHTGLAQDSIVTSDGQKIKARVMKINKKDVQYKLYEDPEFSTYTLQEKEIKSIKLESGKKYLFNHKYPRAFIGIGFDICQPIASFAATNFDGREPGFAVLGFGGQIYGGFYITKRLGLNIKVGTSANTLNIDGYEKIYRDETNLAQEVTVNYDERDQKYFYENWYSNFGMIGPMYSFKVAKWLTIDNRLQVGPMSISRPSVHVAIKDSSSGNLFVTNIDSEKSSPKTAIGYGGGITFRISPGRRIGFLISIDYLHGGARLNFTETISSPSLGNSNSIGVSRVYNVDQLKLGVGIAYQFKRKNR